MKKIIVTGCSTGIGRQSIKILKKNKFHVIATARSDKDVDQLREDGFDCIKMDMGDPIQLESSIREIKSRYGKNIYGIFANAGYGQPGAIEDIPTDILRKQFETNFFGVHTLIRSFLPEMRSEGQGRVVLNSSILGFAAMPYRAAYNASKFAMEGWATTLRLENIQFGIKVSVIQPGPIATQFRSNAYKNMIDNIDVENSIHENNYKKMLKRLVDPKPSTVPFTLPATVVAKKALHAFANKRPRNYYRVTIPTKVMFLTFKILPSVITDRLLRKGL